MKVRIYRIANQFGITKAYRLKIKGYVFTDISRFDPNHNKIGNNNEKLAGIMR